MRITTLIENRPSLIDPDLVSEWGLSLHVAFGGHSILFDTGLSGAFAKNAGRLSVDISSVDAAVLSPHHLDHGGGLRRFVESNTKARVHVGEAPNGECFTKILGLLKKYIGLEKAMVAEYASRFATVATPTEILPDVFLLPHIHGIHPRPTGNLYLKRAGRFIPDDFTHEVAMVIKEEN
jgi:7,8-dihydropterin-6-yl-methyl-4-(beta-D-ribofuranosyl)aminobenzene 5'-phosphate synthase